MACSTPGMYTLPSPAAWHGVRVCAQELIMIPNLKSYLLYLSQISADHMILFYIALCGLRI